MDTVVGLEVDAIDDIHQVAEQRPGEHSIVYVLKNGGDNVAGVIVATALQLAQIRQEVAVDEFEGAPYGDRAQPHGPAGVFTFPIFDWG